MCRRRPAGFSLIELIAILVIIGALAVFAVPRLNIQGFSRYSGHEELLAAVRLAQKTAVASGCSVRFRMNASNDGYSVAYKTDTAPCNSNTVISSRNNMEIDITTDATIDFDGFGVPASKARITLAGGRRLVVEARTGYVHD